MLIAQKAVDNYLNRELDDFSWVKSLSDKEINDLLEDINAPEYAFGNTYIGNSDHKFMRHQKEMLVVGASVGEMIFNADTGVGKSLGYLSLLDTLLKNNKADKALIAVPTLLLVDQFYDAAKLYVPDMRIIQLQGSSSEKIATVYDRIDDVDVFIINYDALVASFKDRITDKDGKKKSVVNKAKTDHFAQLFDVVVYDEIDSLKNWNSLTYHICNRISHYVPYRYGGTATLIGRDAQDVWAQFYCIDRGKTFGNTLSVFRAAFFNQKIKYIKRRKIYEYKLQRGKKKLLHRFLQNRSIRHKFEECHEIPEQKVIDVPVPMPKEYTEYYEDAVENVIQAQKDVSKMDNAFVRMREITSGYTSYFLHDEETGKKQEKKFIDFKSNPKLDKMVELIKSIPDDRKVIVFHEYTKTGQKIVDRLNKDKINHVWIYGDTKDKVGTLKKFKEGNTNVLVANNATGARGLDIPMASYLISYETTVSPRIYIQMLGRIKRPGQKFKVFIYRFIMRDSVDEKVVGFINEGRDLFKSLINGEISL